MMSDHFVIAVRFLDSVPSFHGRGDNGEPEWPPSPLRLFQALVAAAAGKWKQEQFETIAVPALRVLERLRPDVVVPTIQQTRTPYRLYVPNNAGDLVTAAWSRGVSDASISEHRVEKDVQPTRMEGDEAVHFIWPWSEELQEHFETLRSTARSLTHLGWGVDMVAGDAGMLTNAEVDRLTPDSSAGRDEPRTHRWRPTAGIVPTMLRVPREGTSMALIRRHGQWLNRLSGTGRFQSVSPMTTFDTVGYQSATDTSSTDATSATLRGRLCAAFDLLRPDASGFRTFDTQRRCRDVAAMVRHAVAQAAISSGWPGTTINTFVHGHSPDGELPATGDSSWQRFAYLPLPTINGKLRRIESIRRVLIAAPVQFSDEMNWLRRVLAGRELQYGDPQQSQALLTLVPTSNWVVGRYIGKSALWTTVTPVVLPGYDDNNHKKATKLMHTAFVQAGYPRELIVNSELEWRNTGYIPGGELASRYVLPDRINGPRYHVRVKFPRPIQGPLAIGAGRYRGMGLFTIMDE